MGNTERDLPVSLIRGGSFYWVQQKTRLIRPNAWDLHRRVPFAVCLAWLPLVGLTWTHSGIDGLWTLLVDYRVHARVFIAIPLLLVGQIFMEVRFRDMAQQFLDANIIRFDDLSRFRQIMQRTRRLRDAKVPELITLAAVYVQAAFMVESRRTYFGAWAIDATGGLTPAGYYSVIITQAIFLGLLGIALWKWVIWIVVLLQLSRMPLQLDATNGDRTAGLGFLGEVPRAFAPVVMAVSAVVGANWRTQILVNHVTLDGLKWPAVVFTILVLAVFFLPLALFTPMLLREKRLSLRRYGSLQHLFSLQFRQKWAARRNLASEDLLAMNDFSALADLSAAFKNIEEMVSYPFRKGAVASFLGAVILPMLPVISSQIPLREVLKGLFEAMH